MTQQQPLTPPLCDVLSQEELLRLIPGAFKDVMALVHNPLPAPNPVKIPEYVANRRALFEGRVTRLSALMLAWNEQEMKRLSA